MNNKGINMHSFGCTAHARYRGMNPEFVKRVWAKRASSEVNEKYDLTIRDGRYKAVIEMRLKHPQMTHAMIATQCGYKHPCTVARILKGNK